MKKKRAFAGILEGAREALAIAKGEAKAGTYRVHVPPEMDVRKIRKSLDLTQQEFASRYGFGLARVRDWEQGRSRPDAPTHLFLAVIAKHPEVVDDVLRKAS